MLKSPLIIGTRGSDLAMWQANYIKDMLAAMGIEAELKIIKTQGDSILNLRLDKLEGKGFFTKELEEALLNGTIDLAVHSHKDLPTQSPEGLMIAAVPEREDPSELLLILKDCVDVTQKLSVKFAGTIGTSSNRRRAQLLAIRPDLEIEDLRGNVPTRIGKLRDEDYDAIVIARAGVSRLGIDLGEFHVEELEPMDIIPAPAQGALAVQIRENDAALLEQLKAISNPEVVETIAVERQVLHLFEGGCHMPLGCYCRKDEGKYQVWTSKAGEDETLPDRLFLEATSTEGLAEKIVAKYDKSRKLPVSVFITRTLPENSYLRRWLQKHVITIDDRSLIRTFPIINKLDPYILRDIDWIFFSSKNAIEYFFALGPHLSKKTKLGVIGRGSEDTLRRFGKVPDFNGEDEGINTHDIGVQFALLAQGSTVLFPCAKDSLRTIQQALLPTTKGIDLPVYETVMEDEIQQSYAEVLIFTSPSNVEAYFAGNLLEPGQKVICIGRSTGKKFDELGVPYTLPYSPDEIGLAEAIFGLS
jgi:hydroxymethylbilane synthase